MRWLAVVLLVACKDPTAADVVMVDGAVDAFEDPFAGVFDDPSDFPHGNCTPGSLAGFALTEYWPGLAMRTTHDGELAVYLADYIADAQVPHLLTADDLFVRRVLALPQHVQLSAIDVCGVDPDGTLRGAFAHCTVIEGEAFPCSAHEFVASPLHRIAGELEGEHLTLLGEIGGDWPRASSNVRVRGDLAYLARLDDGLRIVAVANPAAPVELGHLAVPGEFANDLELVESSDGRRYAIVASSIANVIDVTDPRAPQLVAQLPFNPHTVFVEGTTAYLATGGNGTIAIWDVSRPRVPRQLGVWTAPDRPDGTGPVFHNLHVRGGIGYLADMYGVGLWVVDFRDPASPSVLGRERDARGLMWHTPWLTAIGGELLAVDSEESSSIGFRIVDADPASPTFLAGRGEWTLRPEVPAHDIMAIGDRAYLAHYRDGVRVVSLADPTSPVQVAYYNTWREGTGTASAFEGAFGLDLDVARKRIYVADATRGLLILEGDAIAFP